MSRQEPQGLDTETTLRIANLQEALRRLDHSIAVIRQTIRDSYGILPQRDTPIEPPTKRRRILP